MTRLRRDQLEQLSKDGLIALVERLWNTYEPLRTEVEQLRDAVRDLKRPPPTSRNSSQPPSRDQKADALRRTRRRRPGAQRGHARRERPLVDNPD